MPKMALLILALNHTLLIHGQVVTIQYSGISPSENSPHWGPDQSTNWNPYWTPENTGKYGIANPERGYQLRAGHFSIPTEDINQSQPLPNISRFLSVNGESLDDYMGNFCRDGISLVEVEQYVNFNEEQLAGQATLHDGIKNAYKSAFGSSLEKLGLKANFIMNSDFSYLPEQPNDPSKHDIDPQGSRVSGLMHYMEQMESFYNEISPYVAVANLGWINAPYDYNMYRLSGKWNKSDEKWTTFKEYTEKPNDPVAGFNFNYHHTRLQSGQRFDWGVTHKYAQPNGQAYSDFNKTRKLVINKMLDYFPYQKLLTSSLNPWSTYIMTNHGFNTSDWWSTRESIHSSFLGINNPTEDFSINSSKHANLYNSAELPRIGYYDGVFAGDTYSHAWTIGNGEAPTEIHWLGGYKATDIDLGQDVADAPVFTDSYLLRSYRSNLWVHGDLPIYETPNETDPDIWRTNGEYRYSSFANHFGRIGEWFQGYYGGVNTSYDANIGEGICSGKLQDGFMSITKLKYFNFTSLGIGHNNELDGRSPYEMTDGYIGDSYYDDNGGGYLGDGIPSKKNTIISRWKSQHYTKNQLWYFGLPVSDRYFENGVKRSAYDYIRDHLGYRLELQKLDIHGGSNPYVKLDLINRGFAAPQNERKIYFVVLDTDNNIVDSIELNNSKSDEDWRFWQPDVFSQSYNNPGGSNYFHDTQYTPNADQFADYGNSLDNIVIGGIPLGEYKSNWHQSHIIDQYEPITYTLQSNTIPSQYFNSDYRVGIWMPDPSMELRDNSKYAVKFANQAQYIHCNGVTVLGTLGTDHTESSTVDSDGDGIPNNVEPYTEMYNPKEYQPEELDYDLQCSSCDPTEHIYEPIQDDLERQNN